MALLFGPAEYFSLMVLGLIFAVVLAKGSIIKAIAMILAGLLFSMVGSDLETGAGRMTFDIPELADGIGFVVLAMGVFGFAEIIRNLEKPTSREFVHAQDYRPDADARRPEGRCTRDRTRHRHRLDARHPAGRRRGHRVVRRLHAGKAGRQGSRSGSAAAPSRASPARKAPTTPPRRPRSFRCSRSAFRPMP